MTSQTAPADRKRVLRASAASTMGWALDLHDLMLILYIAPVLAPVFFPTENETLALAGVYVSFGVSLVMRPVGSAVFGSFADKHGRKKAAYVSIGGVGFITAAMGLVPSYAMIGIAATAAFLIFRLAQGVFVGGIVASTHTLGTESVSPKHTGLMSGVVAGTGAGLGAVVVSLNYMFFTTVLSADAFASYGWRMMFATGVLTSIVSIWLYVRADESPMWEAETKNVPAASVENFNPNRELFSKRFRGVLAQNVILVTGGAALYYLTAGFFPNYLQSNVGMAPLAASISLIIINLTVAVFGPVGGHLSDLYGRRRVFLYAGALNAVLGPILYFALSGSAADQWWRITGIAFVMTVVMAIPQGPILIFLNERFPTKMRATGTAISWNIGYALAGMTPALVTSLSPEMRDVTSRAGLLLGAAGLLLVIGALVVGRDGARPTGSGPVDAAEPRGSESQIPS